jgi:RNA polymerase sigma-70 factor (ECF subfamily)
MVGFPTIAGARMDLSNNFPSEFAPFPQLFLQDGCEIRRWLESGMKELLPSPQPDGLSQTRSSLIVRLRHWDDSQAWGEFFETYFRYIYRCALKERLTEDEAQAVVQDAMIVVAKKIQAGEYRHQRDVATFKTWLSRIVHFLVLRVNRRRQTQNQRIAPSARADDDDSEVSALEQIPHAVNPHEEEWDREWVQNFVDVAAERVKRRVKPAHYQIFASRVIQRRSTGETARELGINVAQVYLVTHRITKLLREEFEQLQKKQPVLPPVNPAELSSSPSTRPRR